MKKLPYISLGVLAFIGYQAHAQKDQLGTEVISVVKPYSPTVSDAFKIKEVPVAETEETPKKKEVPYSIFSFPVASTFTPSKGRAAAVQREPRPNLYDNYAYLGIGNYMNVEAELFANYELANQSIIGGKFLHQSSAGGIDDLIYKDKFVTTGLDLAYGNATRELNYSVEAGFKNRVNYWYGVNRELYNEEPEEYFGFDAKQKRNTAYIGGRVHFNEAVFRNLGVRFTRYWDGFDVSENRFVAQPEAVVDFNGKEVQIKASLDYLSGESRANFHHLTEDLSLVTIPTSAMQAYGYANFMVNPSFVMTRDDWSIRVGGKLAYSADLEGDNSNFYIYPDVLASLNLVENIMIFYAGASGELKQNSFAELTERNTFLAPDAQLRPTHNPFKLYGGLTGKLMEGLSYDAKVTLANEKDKLMFRSRDNYFGYGMDAQPGYMLGNSFVTRYDNVNSIGVSGELRADFNSGFRAGLSGEFWLYDMKDEQEAWNLPSLKIGLDMDVDITEKWFAGLDLFYVGQRKDGYNVFYSPLFPDNETTFVTKDVDGYVDLNLHVGYRYNDRFTAYLKGNNLTGGNYERWLNYPVQSFQVLLGASYKFDF